MTRQQFLGAVAAASCAVAAGCRPGGPTAEPAAPKQATTSQKLRLLVIDDPTLGQTIARQWLAHTESEIEVQSATAADIADARRLPGDIVIFAAAMLAELAERSLVVPLQDEMLAGDDFARQDIFEHVRRHEVNWGRKTFAVPLGSPQLLLLYRSDLFEQRNLQPPASWDEYQSAAAVLAEEKAAGDDAAWQATCEPLADGWAGQTLLARAAGYVLHPNQVSPLFEYDSLEPLIAGPAFVRALEELIAAAKPGMQKKRLTPGEAYAEMLAGRCGMAITWPHNAPQPAAADAKAALPAGVVRCAQLPGASEVYNQSAKNWEPGPTGDDRRAVLLGVAGRMGAITASAAQPRAAQGFLQWLASSEMASRVCPLSQATTIFRQSQAKTLSAWLGPAAGAVASSTYLDALTAANAQSRWMWSLRLPGRHEYMQALDAAVAAAVAGEQKPEEALAKAADAWRKITQRLGVARQRQANQRSLGLTTYQ